MGNRGRRQVGEMAWNDVLLGHTSQQGLDVTRECIWIWEPSCSPVPPDVLRETQGHHGHDWLEKT